MAETGDKYTPETASDTGQTSDDGSSAMAEAPKLEGVSTSEESQIQVSEGFDIASSSSAIAESESLEMSKESGKRKKKVTFPVDELIVTDYYEPVVYFNQNDDAPDQNIVDLYKAACEKLNVTPSEALIPQMRDADPEEPTINICEPLEAPNMEALEPAFRKAQFTKLIISTEQVEEGVRALVEILEFFQTVRVIQINIKSGVSEPVWGVICLYLRKAQTVEELDLSDTPLADPELMFFGKILKRVPSLTVLRMPRCGLKDINLGILSEGLRWNVTVTHVYFNDNDMDVKDCKALAHLLRVNYNIEYMDLSNNQLRNEGVGFLCDAISEQSEEEGVKTLILTNTGLTSEAGTGFNKVLNSSCILETLVLSSNKIGTEGIILMKEGALRSKTLRVLELRGANIDCEGVAHLAQIIYFNPDLERVDLRDNPILYPGLAALRDCLVLGAGPLEIELDDREKEFQPLIEEIRKKSLGIGEDSFHCSPEERGEDFDEKVKLLLAKTEKRRMDGDAVGMQHLAELVEQLKKELQEKKSKCIDATPVDGKPSEEKEEKPDQQPEEKPEQQPEEKPEQQPEEKPEQQPEEKPEQQPEGMSEEQPEEKPKEQPDEKPEEKPEEKDKDDQTGGSCKSDGLDKSDDTRKDKDDKGGGSGGSAESKPEHSSSVQSESSKEQKEPSGTHTQTSSGEKPQKDDSNSQESESKQNVDGQKQQGTLLVAVKTKKQRKPAKVKKVPECQNQQGKPHVEVPNEHAPEVQGQSLIMSETEPEEKVLETEQEEEKLLETKQEEEEKVLETKQEEEIIEVLETEQEEEIIEVLEEPINTTLQSTQGNIIAKIEAKLPWAQDDEEEEEIELTAEERRNKKIAQLQRAEVIQAMLEGLVAKKPVKKKSKKPATQGKSKKDLEAEANVKSKMAQGEPLEESKLMKPKEYEPKSQNRSAGNPKEQPEKADDKKAEAQPQAMGGAKPKDKKDDQKKTHDKRKKGGKRKRDGDEEDDDQQGMAVICSVPLIRITEGPSLPRPPNPPEPTIFIRSRFVRSPEPSPRKSPLHSGIKQQIKKARGVDAGKDAMSEALSQGMSRGNAIIAEQSRRIVVETAANDLQSPLYVNTAVGAREESDEEDQLGAVGGAPKLPPRKIFEKPPLPPYPSRFAGMGGIHPRTVTKTVCPVPACEVTTKHPLVYPDYENDTSDEAERWWESHSRVPTKNAARQSNDMIDYRDPLFEEIERRRRRAEDENSRLSRHDRDRAQLHTLRLMDMMREMAPFPCEQPENTPLSVNVDLYASDLEELPSPELHLRISMMREAFLSTGNPFLRNVIAMRNALDARERQRPPPPPTTIEIIKATLNKWKDKLPRIRLRQRVHTEEEEEGEVDDIDFWDIDFDARCDMIVQETVIESLETAAIAAAAAHDPKSVPNSSTDEKVVDVAKEKLAEMEKDPKADLPTCQEQLKVKLPEEEANEKSLKDPASEGKMVDSDGEPKGKLIDDYPTKGKFIDFDEDPKAKLKNEYEKIPNGKVAEYEKVHKKWSSEYDLDPTGMMRPCEPGTSGGGSGQRSQIGSRIHSTLSRVSQMAARNV